MGNEIRVEAVDTARKLAEHLVLVSKGEMKCLCPGCPVKDVNACIRRDKDECIEQVLEYARS